MKNGFVYLKNIYLTDSDVDLYNFGEFSASKLTPLAILSNRGNFIQKSSQTRQYRLYN